MKQRIAGALVALGLAGCSRSRPAVDFVGRSETPIVDPTGVEESAVLPREAVRLGRLVARCRALDTAAPFEERPLSDVDCSEARLRLWLRQAASKHGGDVLADLHCRAGRTSDCSAILGRRHESSRATAQRGIHKSAADVRGALGAEIWVSYLPTARRFERPARGLERVGELSSLPLSHFVVGSLETRCEACDQLALREALRVTAGRLGASDVVSVRCLAADETERCIAEAAAPFQVESPPY